jgi:hypothetical protein
MKTSFLNLSIAVFSGFLCSQNLNAQKADIDNYNIDVYKANLPENYVSPEKRTYDLKINGRISNSQANIKDEFRLYGWKKVDPPAYMTVAVGLKNLIAGQPNTTSRTEEKKDKDGKIISTTIYHKATNTLTGFADLDIYGITNSYNSYKQFIKDSEKSKNKEKQAKVDKEIASNPFLKNVDKNVKEINDDPKAVKVKVYSLPISDVFTYSTSESKTVEAAKKEYDFNYLREFNNFEKTFIANLSRTISKKVNEYYGYYPVQERMKFKALDSDKHPECVMFKNAIEGTKFILGKLRYNQSVDEPRNDIQPIVDYFVKTSQKYARSKDKHDKNLRAACYYNLAQIFIAIDQPEKAIEIADAIIASKHDEGDGKDFLKKATELMDKLQFHNMKSRHLVPLLDQDKKEDTAGFDLP